MKTLFALVRSSALVACLALLFTVGVSSEAKAQAGPLSVTNMTACPIYVQGHTAIGLTPGCLTTWYMVMPGATISIPACAPSTYHWYHVYYGVCSTPGTGCAQGTTNGPMSICGLATVNIPNPCGSGMYAPVWSNPFTLTFF